MTTIAAAPDPMRDLARAVLANDARGVADVLARFPDVRSRLDEPMPGGHFGATPLLVAVNHGSREVAQVLLDAGADINQRSHWWAGGFGVLDGDNGLTDFLIARGATVDAHAAARMGRLDRLRELVAADPSVVHARGGDGQTPLHCAATVEVARYLLDHGADIDARCVDHEGTPAQWMVRDRQTVARFLVERGCTTDILLAAALGDVARVRDYLTQDPGAVLVSVSAEHFPMRDPRAGGHIYIWTLGAWKTAHVVARDFGREEVYQLLMRETPPDLRLAIACVVGDDDARRAVLAEHPEVARELSPLAARQLADAARDENTAAVQRLLECGWPIDARGQHGGTALHWAAWHGNTSLVRGLMQGSAPLELTDADYGGTPLGWALHGSRHGWHPDRGDYVGTVQALLDAGATLPGPVDSLEASDIVMNFLRSRSKG